MSKFEIPALPPKIHPSEEYESRALRQFHDTFGHQNGFTNPIDLESVEGKRELVRRYTLHGEESEELTEGIFGNPMALLFEACLDFIVQAKSLEELSINREALEGSLKSVTPLLDAVLDVAAESSDAQNKEAVKSALMPAFTIFKAALNAIVGAKPLDELPVDKLAILDALGDIRYINTGTFVAMGVPLEHVNQEIHASNMTKLGADGKPIYREDGKILKGENFVPPNLAPVFEGGKTKHMGSWVTNEEEG